MAAAVLLLIAFAWFFTGGAIKPVEEAHRKQAEFVSAASHELRSPLAVIEMSAGTIRRMPDQALPLSAKIEAECGRLSRLVADLLLLAGSDGGRLDMVKSPASPKTILLTAYERFEELAAEKGVALAPDLPRELPAEFPCDLRRIEQTLAVLIDNAISYTPPGGRIRLSLRAEGERVVFAVADSGPGVPDGEKERIFDRFYRADASRTDKEHYGLGLSVAREIAFLHKGTVTVRDSDLGGAEFLLSLPRQ